MVRYTLLRILIFFGCVAILWLAGVRGEDAFSQLALIVGAALLSMVVSFFALKGFREQYSAEITEKIAARASGRNDTGKADDNPSGRVSDEAAEDAEVDEDGYR